MKKILLLSLIAFAWASAHAQAPIKLDTIGNACHLDSIGFAKDNITYSLNGSASINLTIVGAGKSYSNASYTRFRDPAGNPFGSRQALTDWMDTYFFANALTSDTSSGGGGSVGTLQQTTDAGNSTSNAVQITGLSNYDPALNSLLFGVAGGSAFIQNQQSAAQSNINLSSDGSMVFNTWNADGSSTAQVMRLENGFTGSSSVAATFAGRIKTTEAIDADDAVPLGQMNSVPVFTQNISEVDTGTTLATTGYYFYIGTSSGAFVLPLVSGNAGKLIRVVNDSPAGIVTLRSSDGSNTLSDSGAKVSFSTVLTGTARILVCNGIYWYFIT